MQGVIVGEAEGETCWLIDVGYRKEKWHKAHCTIIPADEASKATRRIGKTKTEPLKIYGDSDL